MPDSATRYTRRAVGMAIAAAIGGFLFGFDSSVVNGAVDALQERFSLSSGFVGFAVASALVGCAIGAIVAGRLADRIGRKNVMLFGSALFLASAIGSGLAFGIWDLICWRLVGGLGIGFASVIAPAYIAEISPRLLRGRLSSLQQLAIVTGIFAALLSDTMFATRAGGATNILWFGLEAWRWMFLLGAVPALVYGIAASRLPESPRYLIADGREHEAREVFARLLPATEIERAVRDIRRTIQQDDFAHRSGSLRGRMFGLRPTVLVGLALAVFQQFVGINVIFYYSSSLWQAVGFDESASLQISVVTAITNIAVTLVSMALVDRIGRKPLLLVGSIGMSAALALMAWAFSYSTQGATGVELAAPWGVIALIAANAFVVFFGVSWGPVMWVLLGEIFPSNIRAKALGLASAANWVANFAVTMSFPVLAALSLPVTYGIYAGFAALSVLFVVFAVPETNGLSLEEAETLFVRRPR